MELCQKMEITRGKTMLEFFTRGEAVILRQEEKPACVFCKSEADIIKHRGKHICRLCADAVHRVG